jgi:hypothetical protein
MIHSTEEFRLVVKAARRVGRANCHERRPHLSTNSPRTMHSTDLALPSDPMRPDFALKTGLFHASSTAEDSTMR